VSDLVPPVNLNIFMVLEAVASVSLSHEEKCTCKTCRAAQGDEQALAEIMLDLEGKL
jgi:hypothetical protein